MTKPCVYIVDDNDGFRQSVAFMLGQTHYRIQQFDCAESVLESLDELETDDEVCMLLDVRMPGLSGLDLHDRVNSSKPELPIIYMTGHADVPLAVEAMKKGAVTLLEKPLDPDALKRAVEAAMDKSRERLKQRVADQSGNRKLDGTSALTEQEQAEFDVFENHLQSLTPRESDVLEFLVQGMANKQCAYELQISVRTVELHRSRLLKKLEVRSGAELIRKVLLHRART